MTERYSRVAVILHWAIAALILLNVLLAWTWDSLPDDRVRPAIDLHKSTGITVLGLVLMRILWRIGHRPPPFPERYPILEKRAAHWAHIALYALILLLPVTGWLHDSAWKDAPTHPMDWYGLFEWPRLPFFHGLTDAAKDVWHKRLGSWHSWAGYGLYALLAAHIAGALKHELLDGEPELARMGFGPRPEIERLGPAKAGADPSV